MGVYTFTQDNLIIPLCSIATSITSTVQLDSFSMRGYDQATVILQFSAIVSGDATVNIESGATDGADTADVTFHYRSSSGLPGSTSSDRLSADATTSVLTLTEATYEGTIAVLGVHADELRTSGETVYDWLSVHIAGAASVGTMAAWAVLSKPRYAKAVMPGALV